MKITEIKTVEKFESPIVVDENDNRHIFVKYKDDGETSVVEIIVDPEGVKYENLETFYIDFIATWAALDQGHIDVKTYSSIYSDIINRIDIGGTIDDTDDTTETATPDDTPETSETKTPDDVPKGTPDTNEENANKIQIMLANGDIYSMDADNVDWESNSANIDQIEDFLVEFQISVIKMMADQMPIEEVESTADNILQHMNLPSYYIFPRTATKPTKREIALLKMFDVYAAYAKIFAYTTAYRTRKIVQNELVEEFNKIINKGGEAATDDDISDVMEAAETIDSELVETINSEEE